MLVSIFATLLASPARAGQSPSEAPSTVPAIRSPPAAQGQPGAPASLPTSELDRVKEALGRSAPLNLRDERLRFYTQTDVAAPQTFASYLGSESLWDGAATRGGNPMTHQEFLNMVTPRDLYGSGGIQAIELLQFALTDWLGKTLVRRGLEEIREAKTEREAREIRERIERELTILNRSSARSQ